MSLNSNTELCFCYLFFLTHLSFVEVAKSFNAGQSGRGQERRRQVLTGGVGEKREAIKAGSERK